MPRAGGGYKYRCVLRWIPPRPPETSTAKQLRSRSFYRAGHKRCLPFSLRTPYHLTWLPRLRVYLNVDHIWTSTITMKTQLKSIPDIERIRNLCWLPTMSPISSPSPYHQVTPRLRVLQNMDHIWTSMIMMKPRYITVHYPHLSNRWKRQQGIVLNKLPQEKVH